MPSLASVTVPPGLSAWKPSRSSAITTCRCGNSRIHFACTSPWFGSVIAVSIG